MARQTLAEMDIDRSLNGRIVYFASGTTLYGGRIIQTETHPPTRKGRMARRLARIRCYDGDVVCVPIGEMIFEQFPSSTGPSTPARPERSMNMSESKHTPGSWTVETRPGLPVYVLAGQVYIAGVEALEDGANNEARRTERAANAALIAAAPDLLAACNYAEAVLDRIEAQGVESGSPAWAKAIAAIRLCRAAIAKAEGDRT